MSEFMRQLAQEAAMVNSGNVTTTEKAKANKAKTGPTFELATASYPDFVITKTTSQMIKQLVIMPSQSAYYIKTSFKNKDKEPVFEQLSESAYQGFMVGYDDSITMPDGFWIEYFENTKKFGEKLVKYLRKPLASELLCCHAAPDFGTSNHYLSADDWIRARELYESCPQLYKEFGAVNKIKKFLTKNSDFASFIYHHYGIDNARVFCKTLMNSLVDDFEMWSPGYYRNPSYFIKENNMQFKAMCEYICYDSVMMGYANNMRRFFDEWRDTLDMQKKLYDKVKEKYPDNLPTIHNQLAYKIRKYEEEINEQNLAKRSAQHANLEMTIGNYKFIVPRTKQDFIDEATQQANCLASYVERFANGEDIIMFMRNKNTPEKSLVTIELSNDFELLQAYEARNMRVSKEEDEVINEWLAAIRSKSSLVA